MNHTIQKNRTAVLSLPAVAMFIFLSAPASAQGLPGASRADIGRLSTGIGFYEAPDGAISDSGFYALARLEVSSFKFEIDYALDDPNFFLGAIDYLYYIPTSEGITQTAVAFGAGYTFMNSDAAFDSSKSGLNVLGQVRIADTIEAQVRYDFLGGNSNLFTFGMSYALF